MIAVCPRCDHRFDAGSRTAAACPECSLVFHPGDDLLGAVTAPESYLDEQVRQVATAPPADAAAGLEVPCHAHPDTVAIGTCPGCHRPICAWCNVVESGGQPVCETCYFNDVVAAKKQSPSKPSELLKRGFAPRQPVLWELRGTLGRGDALQRTWTDIMLRPADFFRSMPLAGDSWSPLVFALSWAMLGLLLRRVWHIAHLLLRYREAVDRGAGLDASSWIWGALGAEVSLVLLVPLVALTMFLLEVAAIQTLLLVTGERHARIRITWRLAGYAAAPWVFLFIPGVGLAVATVTHLGVLASALCHGYHLKLGRAWLVSGAPYALVALLWYRLTLQQWAEAGYQFLFGG